VLSMGLSPLRYNQLYVILSQYIILNSNSSHIPVFHIATHHTIVLEKQLLVCMCDCNCNCCISASNNQGMHYSIHWWHSNLSWYVIHDKRKNKVQRKALIGVSLLLWYDGHYFDPGQSGSWESPINICDWIWENQPLCHILHLKYLWPK